MSPEEQNPHQGQRRDRRYDDRDRGYSGGYKGRNYSNQRGGHFDSRIFERIQEQQQKFFKELTETLLKGQKEMTAEVVEKVMREMFRFVGESAKVLKQEKEDIKKIETKIAQIADELPKDEQAEIKSKEGTIEKEIEKVEKDAVKNAKEFLDKANQIIKENPELKDNEGIIDGVKTAMEAMGKIELGAEEEAKKLQVKTEIAFAPEAVKQIQEEILKELLENNEKRKELLKEKRALGQEFEKVYWEMTNFIQADPMAGVLYRKWAKNLMKGKDEEAEKFYQEGEGMPAMAALNKREEELKKEWASLHDELKGLDRRNSEIRDNLAKILSGGKIEIPAVKKAKEVKKAPKELTEEEKKIMEEFDSLEAQQKFANYYLEKIFEGEEQEAEKEEILSKKEKALKEEVSVVTTTEEGGQVVELDSDEIINDEPVEPPPLPGDVKKEEKKIEKEEEKIVGKWFLELKSDDPNKVAGAFDSLYKEIDNPLYREILLSKLPAELESTLAQKKMEDEAYLQNLIYLAGETKDKSFWPKLYSYLTEKDFSETSKNFITITLYKIDDGRFSKEAKDIYEKGGKGAQEAIDEIAKDDKELERILQKEEILPPSIPKIKIETKKEKKTIEEEEGIEFIEEKPKETKEEEGIEFIEKEAKKEEEEGIEIVGEDKEKENPRVG